jgi:hypothetical protein
VLIGGRVACVVLSVEGDVLVDSEVPVVTSWALCVVLLVVGDVLVDNEVPVW